jgi:hypothetical protein
VPESALMPGPTQMPMRTLQPLPEQALVPGSLQGQVLALESVSA